MVRVPKASPFQVLAKAPQLQGSFRSFGQSFMSGSRFPRFSSAGLRRSECIACNCSAELRKGARAKRPKGWLPFGEMSSLYFTPGLKGNRFRYWKYFLIFFQGSEKRKWREDLQVVPWVNASGIPFWGRCTTHFSQYFSGDWDVYWKFGFILFWGFWADMARPGVFLWEGWGGEAGGEGVRR